jgi:hypothetical protein
MIEVNMAKKRKINRNKSIALKRAVKPKKPETTPAQAEHILGLSGGILVVVASIVAIILNLTGSVIFPGMGSSVIWPIIGLIFGIVMILLTWHIARNPTVAGIFLLLLSLLSLMLPLYGFIVGPILGIIGAIIVFVKYKQ